MKTQGFSLLDLVIAMAIMGILASIAVPSFNQNVRKARRSDGLNTLLEISQQQERFFFRNNTYTSDLTSAAGLNRGTTDSLGSHYTMSVSLVAGPPYEISAIAKSTDDQFKDKTCRTFKLTSTGVKSVQDSDSNDTTAQCWGD